MAKRPTQNDNHDDDDLNLDDALDDVLEDDDDAGQVDTNEDDDHGAVETDLSGASDEAEVVVVDADEDNTGEDDEPSDKKAASAEDKPAEVERKSRARERIQELNGKLLESERERKFIEYNAAEDRKKFLEEKATFQKTFLSKYEADLEQIGNLINKYTEEGNAVEAQRYNKIYIDTKDDLGTIKNSLKPIEDELEKAKESSERLKREVETGDVSTPRLGRAKKLAEEWGSKNPWFRLPVGDEEEKKQKYANTLFKRLLVEGFDPNDEDTFKELDVRVAKVMGDVVESKGSTSSKATKQPEVRTLKKSLGHTQVVSGKGRPTTQGVSLDSSKKQFKVSLTASEKQTARELGITEQEYAKEKVLIAKREKGLI